jgi:hypothetical protein
MRRVYDIYYQYLCTELCRVYGLYYHRYFIIIVNVLLYSMYVVQVQVCLLSRMYSYHYYCMIIWYVCTALTCITTSTLIMVSLSLSHPSDLGVPSIQSCAFHLSASVCHVTPRNLLLGAHPVFTPFPPLPPSPQGVGSSPGGATGDPAVPPSPP